MANIPLNEQSVAAYFELMTNPAEHKLNIRPLKECFEAADTAIAQHLLFAEYRKESPACPKIFFYIVMEMVYGPARYKDQANGCFGFNLRFVPKISTNNLEEVNEKNKMPG